MILPGLFIKMSEKKRVDQRPDARRPSVTDGKIVFTAQQ
jgi:hypothetical protein